ncbi:MAG: hypothetical protein R3B48_17710 [Kofleriaceae bacterium]
MSPGGSLGTSVWSALLALLVAGCYEPTFSICGDDGPVCPAGYQCRGAQCVSELEISACEGVAEDGPCGLGLDGLCRDGYCHTNLCGNELLDVYPSEREEVCDGQLGLLACADAGADFGLTSCSPTCALELEACESFAWRRVRRGPTPARMVVGEGTGAFVAYRTQVAWRPNATTPWVQSSSTVDPIGDVVPLSASSAMVLTQRSATQLGLWHYQGEGNLLTATPATLPTAGDAWSGGVALDAQTVAAALGDQLRVFRLSSSLWTELPLSTAQPCAGGGALKVHWATSPTEVYGTAGDRVVRFTFALPAVTCAVVRDLGRPIVALGGQGTRLRWVVDAEGLVYDATTWAARNLDPAEPFAADAAVAQYVRGVPRLWATRGADVHVFESGTWWRSLSGSAVVPDGLGGTFSAHRPLYVIGARVFAAQNSKDAGLVTRNAREWLLGWQTSAGTVADLLVDDAQRPWTILGTNQLAIGSRVGTISGLTAPLVPMTLAQGRVVIGARNGVFTLGDDFSVTAEGTGLTQVKGVWGAADGTLYAATPAGLYQKAPSDGAWILLRELTTSCPAVVSSMRGAMVAGAPRLFVACREDTSAPDGTKLLIYDPATGASSSVGIPPGGFSRLEATTLGEAWLVSGTRVVRVAPPYGVADVRTLEVERKNPATGMLGPLNENYTDLLVTASDEVYLSARRQNLFWWDAAHDRFVRVSSSQGTSAAYVALASFGAQVYAAHETGVDLLLRHPEP